MMTQDSTLRIEDTIEEEADEVGAPERTCVGCRQVCGPDDLERFVVFEGRLLHDVRGRAPGRGAWVMPRQECLARALKSGFQRSFKGKLEQPTLEELVAQLRETLLVRLREGVQVGARARQLAVGAEALKEAMRGGAVCLVWMAKEGGESTRRKYLMNASRKGIEVVDDLSGGEIGAWLGREFVSVLGVCDASRAKRMTRDLRNLRALGTFGG